MPLSMTVNMRGSEEVQRMLDRVSPSKNPAPARRALVACALRVQEIATKEMIIRGGRIGKGRKKTDAPADATRLTSRTGRLRGSIRVNRGGLPHYIDIGSDVAYAAIHEFGGSIRGGRMPERPYLQPSLEKASKDFSRIFAREITRGIR